MQFIVLAGFRTTLLLDLALQLLVVPREQRAAAHACASPLYQHPQAQALVEVLQDCVLVGGAPPQGHLPFFSHHAMRLHAGHAVLGEQGAKHVLLVPVSKLAPECRTGLLPCCAAGG